MSEILKEIADGRRLVEGIASHLVEMGSSHLDASAEVGDVRYRVLVTVLPLVEGEDWEESDVYVE